jgi:hypothetical protein
MLLLEEIVVELRKSCRNPEWFRSHSSHIRRIARMALLGKYLSDSFAAPPLVDRPWESQQMRAHRLVWSAIASDLNMTIAHGALPMPHSASPESFISLTRERALKSAESRRTMDEPTIEGAYTMLLRWLHEWDAKFDAAQADAVRRSQEDAERVRAIRERASAEAPSAHKQIRSRKAETAQSKAAFSSRLADHLRAVSGSVLEFGVRVVGPDRFKSYERVLEDAWVAVGGELEQLFDARRRGDIEILSETAGYGTGRGGKRSVILEYVVHPFDLKGA